MFWRPSVQKRRISNGGRIVKSLLSNRPEMLYLARIGGQTYWHEQSQNARACDKRLARFITHMHNTSDYMQYSHVGNTAQHCWLELSQGSNFVQNRPGESSVYLRESKARSLKLTSVSHRSTESDVISLDAGLCMDGITALDLWDLVFEVLHSSLNQPRARGNLYCDAQSENVPT